MKTNAKPGRLIPCGDAPLPCRDAYRSISPGSGALPHRAPSQGRLSRRPAYFAAAPSHLVATKDEDASITIDAAFP